jgi:hypothetical protein
MGDISFMSIVSKVAMIVELLKTAASVISAETKKIIKNRTKNVRGRMKFTVL